MKTPQDDAARQRARTSLERFLWRALPAVLAVAGAALLAFDPVLHANFCGAV